MLGKSCDRKTHHKIATLFLQVKKSSPDLYQGHFLESSTAFPFQEKRVKQLEVTVKL